MGAPLFLSVFSFSIFQQFSGSDGSRLLHTCSSRSISGSVVEGQEKEPLLSFTQNRLTVSQGVVAVAASAAEAAFLLCFTLCHTVSL
jgi:hypothetical protein